jgi:hypothetical protein
MKILRLKRNDFTARFCCLYEHKTPIALWQLKVSHFVTGAIPPLPFLSLKMSRRARIRFWLWLFIVALVLSGVTAFPLETEVRALARLIGADANASTAAFANWIVRVRDALIDTNARHPFMSYGTDWLAFAHLVIAVAFIGPLRDPVRNIWVVEFGMIACVMVIPLALIAGEVRGIPMFWRMIDCSFGVLGIVPLAICRHEIKALEKETRG